jgi:crossover junction endodeoxyribonuclease RuvC
VLGHARGVAVLAAIESELPVLEYTPRKSRRPSSGYGRADKNQMQQMVKLLLGLDAAPSPSDAADALAVAICHIHASGPVAKAVASAARGPRSTRSWRDVKIDQLVRRQLP